MESSRTQGSQPTRPRALIVDDDGFQLALLKELLHESGWADVTTCNSARAALAAVQHIGANAYGLMLVDLHMPEMDGFQFMAQIEAAGFRGAMVIVSGQSSVVMHSAELVAQLRRFKLLGTVAKPVQKAELLALIGGLQPTRAYRPAVSTP